MIPTDFLKVHRIDGHRERSNQLPIRTSKVQKFDCNQT